VNWNRHRAILIPAAIAIAAVAGIAFLTPLPLSAIRADDPSSRPWLFLSDSGAQWGIITILLITSITVAVRQANWRDELKKGIMLFASLAIFIATIAAVNEVVIKRLTKIPRPFAFRLEQENIIPAAKLYFHDRRKQRTETLREALNQNAEHPFLKNLHPGIRDHWLSHTGYSFPSGHSLCAFGLATLLAFISQHFINPRLIWLPFLWAAAVALSRVAIGAHSPQDVTVGAGAGVFISTIILSLGWMDWFLPRENSADPDCQ